MSPARIIILVVALVAGLGAALLIQRPSRPAAPAVTRYEPAPTVPVLVAAADIPLGNTVAANDLRWVDWPASSVPAGVLRKDETPGAEAEVIGQLARVALQASDPIRREKLIKTDGSGFLSAVLPSGKRATAISTDSRGANTAGGFILPNDRADVIRTFKEDTGNTNSENYTSETILTNVRVLAIGQNIQERNGEKVVVGETATLELDPRQVEIVAQAQKSGTLSLALRSLKDANDAGRPSEEGGMTLVRYGVTSRNVKQ
ncbi:Flp pilus assembly protein CpaB [Bosea caraganae]|uniref:Flp pilus assembly protein CpaB n=1 Tax=Bosea caraganae TaxID=2763117 RepID=A0A370L904_9HYPH|nr:Flp pilus assembly protein CpaB [Bosea caraganae]RDJ26880.1 Flp pilus assembly protein CpaB [Bosea caraganae]RDJ30768.1 Flp pilus assembly protein CpaB [Bosea caraganae]